MPKKLQHALPEAFVSNTNRAALVFRELNKGNIRKLGPKVYSSNLHDDPSVVIRRNLWTLIAEIFPDAVITDRTAIETAPSSDGSVFLISKKKNSVRLPGITIRPRKGPPSLPNDRDFIGGLKLASPARACLENMRPSRARSGLVSRTLSLKEMEEHLEDIMQKGGTGGLNKIRDDARKIAPKLKLQNEFYTLDRIIGGLLATKPAKLTSPRSKARALGLPYDAERLQLFEDLRRFIQDAPPITRPKTPSMSLSNTILPFFEAYFSNFIEGTEFEVDEAAEIIFGGKIPKRRPEDAHDILGTFNLVSDYKFMSHIPKSANEFLAGVKSSHLLIMGKRLDKHPGEFKRVPNRVGVTVFVAPELVEGTLLRGFELSRSISSPFGRAVFMMFLISEIHPFLDGNGRTARLWMNVELEAAKEVRIIIPPVYRNDYMGALKALTINRRAEALWRALDFAQRYTASIDWSTLKQAQKSLKLTNAFCDPGEAEAKGLYLSLLSRSS